MYQQQLAVIRQLTAVVVLSESKYLVIKGFGTRSQNSSAYCTQVVLVNESILLVNQMDKYEVYPVNTEHYNTRTINTTYDYVPTA